MCYVADIDWSRSGFGDGEIQQVQQGAELLLRGRVAKTRHAAFGKLGSFRAAEGYRGAGTQGAFPFGEPPPEGESVVRLRDNGTRCITAPCPSFDLGPLNRKRKEGQSIDEVDLSGVEASEADRQAAHAALFAHRGLLARGRLESFDVVFGSGVLTGTRFVASVYFLEPVPETR